MSTKNKPWAVLKISRKQYDTWKPWKKTPLSKKDFEKMVLEFPDGFMDHVRLLNDAERLVEAMFKVDTEG